LLVSKEKCKRPISSNHSLLYSVSLDLKDIQSSDTNKNEVQQGIWIPLKQIHKFERITTVSLNRYLKGKIKYKFKKLAGVVLRVYKRNYRGHNAAYA